MDGHSIIKVCSKVGDNQFA